MSQEVLNPGSTTYIHKIHKRHISQDPPPQVKQKVKFYFKINIDCYISSFLLQGKTVWGKYFADVSDR
jgi:hypothetical protein